eukprot:108330-Chlamydomonas_euryale.AAC.1
MAADSACCCCRRPISALLGCSCATKSLSLSPRRPVFGASLPLSLLSMQGFTYCHGCMRLASARQLLANDHGCMQLPSVGQLPANDHGRPKTTIARVDAEASCRCFRCLQILPLPD